YDLFMAPETPICRDSAPDIAEIPAERATNVAAYRSDEAVRLYTTDSALTDVEQHLIASHFSPDGRVLDLACGAGRTTGPLHAAGFTVTGIDLSSPLIEAARQRFPDLDLRVGDFSDLDLPDASYDAVLISFNGLDYAFPASQRARALRECARVLVPGGRLIFSSHNIKALHASPYFIRHRQRLVWMLRSATTAFRRAAYVEDLNGQWTYFASPARTRAELDDAGFDLIDTVGFRRSRNRLFNLYCSPWVHYVGHRRR
ncbi:MAG: class I SAM-dependent methyltransferase, partial [Acidobacteriota bacterium]